MNKQSYLDSRQLQNECNECIKILKSELLEIEKVSNNIKLVLNESDLTGEALEAYKKQLSRYFEIFVLMKEADRFDIIDYSKLKAEATKTYDGDLICTSYERAKNDRDKYQTKANDERSKAASFNTTVTTLLPGGKVLVEHIPNPYESSAREYQNLADDCQKEMNLWHSKMEEFDAIEARTVGLFVAGKNKRTIAKMKLRTINKTPISGSRTRSGGGTGGLISYIPDTPKTTINEDVLKGAKILEDKLRMMTNEDGTPKYTEKEIQEMVEYVIKHHPNSLTSLYHIPSQYYTNQMDLVLKYAMEAKQMIPIYNGADLFANYLRNLKNPDGTPMYTETEIQEMVQRLLKEYPSSLSSLYYAPTQYYDEAAEQCLEYALRPLWYGNPMQLDGISTQERYLNKRLSGLMIPWNQDKIDAVWEAAELFYDEYGINYDPRVMLAVIIQEGNGSFNTSSTNLAADGQNGPETNFAVDLTSANELLFGKFIGYLYFRDEFEQCVAESEILSSQGDGGIFDYYNWNTPIIRPWSNTVYNGVYANHSAWGDAVEDIYEDLTYEGAYQDYSNYVASIDDSVVQNLVEGMDIPDYEFRVVQEGQNSSGKLDGTYIVRVY